MQLCLRYRAAPLKGTAINTWGAFLQKHVNEMCTNEHVFPCALPIPKQFATPRLDQWELPELRQGLCDAQPEQG